MKQIVYMMLVVSMLFISGCSDKEVFKPTQSIVGDWPYQHDLNSSIVSSSSNGAILQNGQILYQNKIINTDINYHNQRLLHVQKKWIILSTVNGKLTLIRRSDLSKKIVFHLKKTIAAVTVHKSLIAVLFASDNIALYSLKDKQIVFQSPGNAPVAVDQRIVNPYFLNNLVIFPTLDGSLTIVNSTTKRIVKSIIVSSKQYFNNVIDFEVAGNNLISASGYKVLSVEQGTKRASFDVRDIKYFKGTIYVATKSGDVYALTKSLQIKSKISFPFAHFLGMIVTKKRVYLLLRQGYLISLNKDFKSYKIYDADIDKDGLVYVGRNAFYVNGQYFAIDKHSNVQ